MVKLHMVLYHVRVQEIPQFPSLPYYTGLLSDSI